jgi:hypothetical protein
MNQREQVAAATTHLHSVLVSKRQSKCLDVVPKVGNILGAGTYPCVTNIFMGSAHVNWFQLQLLAIQHTTTYFHPTFLIKK